MSTLFDEVEKRYRDANRLSAVIFEVTHRCLCDCRHCLLTKTPKDELSLREIADLLQQLRAEGVLNLGITGGEPFLRDDLPQIFELARQSQFFVSLLTTGIMIGQTEVDLLCRLKISNIEISVLGARPQTHDFLTRHPGAFERMLQAVRRLQAAGLTVNLKCTVMTPNYRELEAMRALARDLDTGFSASVSVAPRIDGDTLPQSLGLSEQQVAELTPELTGSGLIAGDDHRHGALLTCRAGRTVAGVSPDGDVFPCILFRRKIGNIRQRKIQDLWHDDPDPFLSELRRLGPKEVSSCFSCEVKPHCPRCPGVAYLETGEIDLPSPSACIAARGMAAARASRGSAALERRRTVS